MFMNNSYNKINYISLLFTAILLCQLLNPLSIQAADGIPYYEIPSPTVKIPNQRGYTGWKSISDKGVLIYEGYLQDGKFHGEGKLYNNGAIVYDGNWSNGVYDGVGTAYYGNGYKRYSGNIRNGILTGYGTYYHDNGNRSYEGYLKEGYREGFGISFGLDGNEIERKEYIDWTIVNGGVPSDPGRWGISTNFTILNFSGIIGESDILPSYFDSTGKPIQSISMRIESNKNYNVFIQGSNFTTKNPSQFLDITRLKVKVADKAFQPVTTTATLLDSDKAGTYTKELFFNMDLSDSNTLYNDSVQTKNIAEDTEFSTTITITYTGL